MSSKITNQNRESSNLKIQAFSKFFKLKFKQNPLTYLALFLVISLLSTLSSCAQKKSSFINEVSPKFAETLQSSSQKFLSSSEKISNDSLSDQWWKEFGDEFLNQIIGHALERNQDIKLANSSIINSRQLNNIDASALIPSGKINLERQRFASPAFGPNGIEYDLYQSVLDVGWEVDIFGKNLDNYKASKLRFLKDIQLFKLNNIRIASEVAQNYFLLKAQQYQVEKLEEILLARKNLHQISINKEQQGIAFKSEKYQSEIELNNIQSQLISAKSEERLTIYKIAVLLGETPEKTLEIFSQKQNSKKIFDYSSTIVPLGLKSDLLKRRPDILAAEYEIDAALYEKSAQFKEFFPSFNLTARVGGGAKDVGDVLNNGFNVKDIRGGISLPIFSIPQLLAQYKISKTRAKNAVINYEKAILNAFSDCESQLTRYLSAVEVEQNSLANAKASAKIYQINQNKKLIGASSLEELLLSKISYLNSEIILAEKKATSLSNLAILHKALGGGFEGYDIKISDDKAIFISKNSTAKK